MVTTLRWLSGFGVSALCWVTACGVSSDPASLGDDRGLDDDPNKTPPVVEATGILPPTAEQLAALCAEPEAGEKLFTQETIGQASTAIVGAWFRCPDEAFTPLPDAAITATGVTSVEFDASGKVYVLRDQGGRLRRGDTTEYQGSWIVEIDQPGSIAEGRPGGVGMVVSIDGVRNDRERLFLAEGPKKFRFNGVDYVAAPGPEGFRVPNPTPSPKGPARPSIEGLCPPEEGDHLIESYPFASTDEEHSAIVGSWFVCSPSADLPVFGTTDGVVGVEFSSDGKFYKLYDEGGFLVRGQGFGRTGEWALDGFEGQVTSGMQVRVDGLGIIALSRGPEFFIVDGDASGGPNLFSGIGIGVTTYFSHGIEDEGTSFFSYARVPAP